MSHPHRTGHSTWPLKPGLANWLGVFGMLAAGSASAPAAVPTTAQLEFFEQRIRPILVSDCYECHGAEKQRGGLRVDFRDGLRQGGDSGPAIVPGSARDSLLIQSIAHTHQDSKMPKDRPKLAGAVIADFERWVNEGAADPRDEPPAEFAGESVGWESVFNARREWWSFQPVRPHAVPSVKNAAWSDHPVDRFLLAAMEQRGLAPAAPADRRTLLRRVTFALTGLPPTPAEMQAFLADESSDAFAHVVDRLLESPRFGERWARHWMDLVRFAETHGSEADPEIAHAWRYRDYLIRAFNADVPWDQLIREHVAGDLFSHPRLNYEEGINESLLGLAHLRLVEHGFQPVDTLDEQVKTVDNQIDVISKAFQGLTTSCARCHDHKFDPISQKDYFALYGILASSRPAQLTVDLPEKLRVHRGELERLKGAIKTELADAWTRAAGELTEVLRQLAPANTNRLTIPGDELAARIAGLEAEFTSLERAGRAAVLRQRGVESDGTAVAPPVAAWTFEGDARDLVGNLHGELHGDAVIRDGRLVLDGQGDFVQTPPLVKELRAKTLEVWAAPANLEQRGGGVLTVETKDGGVFDSLVFAEGEPRKWMAGSEGFRRTRSFEGPDESGGPDELVHLALVYHPDHRVELFRNGTPYGTAYSTGEERGGLRTYEAGTARVLLGRRHTGGGNPFFTGAVGEARLYDRALTTDEVAVSHRAGPGLVTREQIELALTPEQRHTRQQLRASLAALKAELDEAFPDYTERDAQRTRLLNSLADATKDNTHPLHVWQQLRRKGDTPVAQLESGAAKVSPLRESKQRLRDENVVERKASTRPDNAEAAFAAVPLTPALSPGERETASAAQRANEVSGNQGAPVLESAQATSRASATEQPFTTDPGPATAPTSRTASTAPTPPSVLPLPGGEGRGEGEGRARSPSDSDSSAASNHHPDAGKIRQSTIAQRWQLLVNEQAARRNSLQHSNSTHFSTWWDATSASNSAWFAVGANPPEHVTGPGEFTVEPDGDRVLTGVLPGGVFSHRLSQKHNGVFTSPRFQVTHDSISLLVVGGKGARVRLIPDNYPIGAANIFPQATLDSDAPRWVRLDTAYRKGVMAHLEFVTAGDSLSRERTQPGPGGRSFFGVMRVVFHDTKKNPEAGLLPLSLALRDAAPNSAEDFSQRLGRLLAECIAAWRANTLDEEQRLFLDSFVRTGLLPVALTELPTVAPLIAEYRRLENEIPEPRRAPGVVDATGYNAPLLTRGDHLRPADPVPRGYLTLVRDDPYHTPTSGRRELADDLTRADNPLTSRVLVNRIWHHLFGRGLVPTVDNFGRLGEPATHPELLDFLAARFVERGWSPKDMIRFLVTTRAWQMSSEPSLRARELDPANEFLSHARVRRLEAEAIRDGLLAVSGRLDLTMYGPGADALAPPAEQRRRSVYLTIRRNFLSPFLEIFDAPRPFSTLGRRDATNVPGQSLALLNDPFVSEQAECWAAALLQTHESADARVRRMFEQAFGRPPTDPETAASRQYFAELTHEHGRDREPLVWRDFAQSLFNLKEFIYVR